MTTTLVVCVGCARHVRASDARCPFCGATVVLGEAPQREHLHLLVNGVRSPAFDLAFNNGTVAPNWDTLPPGQTARDERAVLAALMPAPGEYALVLAWDEHVVARRTVTVTP